MRGNSEGLYALSGMPHKAMTLRCNGTRFAVNYNQCRVELPNTQLYRYNTRVCEGTVSMATARRATLCKYRKHNHPNTDIEYHDKSERSGKQFLIFCPTLNCEGWYIIYVQSLCTHSFATCNESICQSTEREESENRTHPQHPLTDSIPIVFVIRKALPGSFLAFRGVRSMHILFFVRVVTST